MRRSLARGRATGTAARRRGIVQRFVVPVEVCVDDRGTVSEVRILRSSRFPAHDPKIVSELGRWRYAPFEVRGVAERACGMVNIPYGPQRD